MMARHSGACMGLGQARVCSGAFVLLDERVGVVVVNRFEVFGFDAVPEDVLLKICLFGDVADEIFYEDGVVVGTFGDCLFVGAFEDAIEFAGGTFFDDVDEVLNPDGEVGADGEGDVTALVMCTTVADGF